jgi:hypothetical protein
MTEATIPSTGRAAGVSIGRPQITAASSGGISSSTRPSGGRFFWCVFRQVMVCAQSAGFED